VSSAPVGESLAVVGHGRRIRQQAGAVEAGAQPTDDEVWVRRYRCRDCGAVITVMPRGMRPRLRYRVVSIVHGLALWTLDGLSSAAVRNEICPTRSVAHEASRCWSSLRRWLEVAASWVGRRLVGSGRRERAEDLLQQLASRVLLSSGALVTDALLAAEQLDGHRAGAIPEEASTM